MNAKCLILGTIVGGIVLFVWGKLTHREAAASRSATSFL